MMYRLRLLSIRNDMQRSKIPQAPNITPECRIFSESIHSNNFRKVRDKFKKSTDCLCIIGVRKSNDDVSSVKVRCTTMVADFESPLLCITRNSLLTFHRFETQRKRVVNTKWKPWFLDHLHIMATLILLCGAAHPRSSSSAFPVTLVFGECRSDLAMGAEK